MARVASDLRRGNAIRLNGEMVIVQEMSHVKPGKGPAYLQGKLRDVRSGAVREYRFRMDEKVEQVFTESKKSSYSYRSGDEVIFLDEESFEEYRIPLDGIEDRLQFFSEGEVLDVEFADGAVIGIGWPEYVTRTVTQTMHDVKAAKVTNQVKPATIDTDIEVAVPIFIKEGDRIRIQVATGKYHERVK